MIMANDHRVRNRTAGAICVDTRKFLQFANMNETRALLPLYVQYSAEKYAKQKERSEMIV